MASSRTLIVCKSVHHHNTLQVAESLADVMHAKIVAPEEFPPSGVADYDVVGFGSGIYYGRCHAALLDWVRGLPPSAGAGRRAFVFSTSGLPFLWWVWHRGLKAELARKGFTLVGDFRCRGFDSWGPLQWAGGLNRGHPDSVDLEHAGDFARDIVRQPRVAPSLEAAG